MKFSSESRRRTGVAFGCRHEISLIHPNLGLHHRPRRGKDSGHLECLILEVDLATDGEGTGGNSQGVMGQNPDHDLTGRGKDSLEDLNLAVNLQSGRSHAAEKGLSLPVVG